MANLRFRDRVLISFFTVILLPILLLGVLAPTLYSRTVARLSEDHMRDMVDMVTKNLDLMIRSQEKILTMCLEDSSLRQFFFSAESGQYSVTRLEALFSSVRASHPEITGIIAVTSLNNYYSRELERISRDPLIEEKWFNLAKKSPAEFGLVTIPIGRNLMNNSGYAITMTILSVGI